MINDMKEILITCPPMIKNIDLFKKRFNELNFKITIPKMSQTLSEEKLIKIVYKYDGWIIGDDPATEKVLKLGKQGKLKALIKWGIGIDNIDLEACKKYEIKFSNTPDIFGDEVADIAIGYMIGLSRNTFLIDREIRKGKWVKPTGSSLKGKTVGIVGLGDIGKNIAKRSKILGLRTIGWDPNFTNQESIDEINEWPKKLNECDFLILSCALNQETHNIFNRNIFKKIKKGLRVINVSRGQLINEKDLLEGLKSSLIKSVALDVFEEEPILLSNQLLNFEECIFGSHNASNTLEGVLKASDKSIDLLDKFLK
jgi:D-3-phosphoglycerate dehydrogenase